MGAIQPGIREAQLGKCLPHGTEGFIHALSTNGLEASGEQATVVVASNDDEGVDMGVRRGIMEVGILLERGSESHPGVKQMVSVSSGHSHDAVAGHLHCSKEIRAESITVGRQYMRQGVACGKQALKRVSSCMSIKSWHQERMLARVLALPVI